MLVTKTTLISNEEYLSIERSAQEKHELHEGHIVTMSGASIPHNRIVKNIIGNLWSFLRGKSCEVFPSDLRVHIPTADSFTYPDATIVCGKPDTLDNQLDTITNPTAIIEVMSKSTEQYDRGTKFFYYIQIPSLKEYILISSITCYVQKAKKQSDSSWKFNEISTMQGELSIDCINYSIPLTAIYEGVD